MVFYFKYLKHKDTNTLTNRQDTSRPLPPSPIPIVSAFAVSHQGSSSHRDTVTSFPRVCLRKA